MNTIIFFFIFILTHGTCNDDGVSNRVGSDDVYMTHQMSEEKKQLSCKRGFTYSDIRRPLIFVSAYSVVWMFL